MHRKAVAVLLAAIPRLSKMAIRVRFVGERGKAVLTMAEMNIDITNVIERAIEKIRQEGYTVQKWIPCSERLPEKDTDVIVCCYGSDLILTHDGETMQDAVERTHRECVRVTIGFIGSDGWYGADWFPMIVSPTYWMPLPEPPEGGADNGNG